MVICSFLNTIGGKIYVGIGEDGKVYTQYSKENVGPLIGEFFRNTFSPSPLDWVRLDYVDWNDKNILVISVRRPRENVFFTYNGNYYIRVGERSRLLSSDTQNILDEIISNVKIAKGQSVLSEYMPTNTRSYLEFQKIKEQNNVHYKRIGKPSKNTAFFFKYCSLDTVLSIFRKEAIIELEEKESEKRNPSQTIRFVEPPYWDDQYERRFYTADYKKVKTDSDAIPKLYATCFTPREESEPAWQIYNRGKEGLGKRCVQFRLNQVALRKELVKNVKNCTIVEGTVSYESKWFIDKLHLSTTKDGESSELYDKYFSDFTLDNFLNLLLLKRTAYEHEQEVRIFLIYDDDKNGKKAITNEDAGHKDISLDWLSMLEGIKVDSECSDIEINLLQDEINRLIDDSGREIDVKEILKRKLKVRKYNVNESEDGQIPIGETYEEYEKRNEERNKQ